MSKLYTISEASKILNVSSETLRHYDRINLVKPTFIDPESGYRYYSKKDIIKLSTIKTLRIMDLSLEEIKKFFHIMI